METNFIGFRKSLGKENNIYGWLQASVSEDGESFEVLKYGYISNPHAKVFTGLVFQNEGVDFFLEKNSVTLLGATTFKEFGVLKNDSDPVQWKWFFEGGEPETLVGKIQPEIKN
ncbi:hypothetical protein E1171_04275 [Cytophagales bacterium RKSG123]|nr:hypothetical protein [Xanthovirga aplysinae]